MGYLLKKISATSMLCLGCVMCSVTLITPRGIFTFHFPIGNFLFLTIPRIKYESCCFSWKVPMSQYGISIVEDICHNSKVAFYRYVLIGYLAFLDKCFQQKYINSLKFGYI